MKHGSAFSDIVFGAGHGCSVLFDAVLATADDGSGGNGGRRSSFLDGFESSDRRIDA